MALNAQKTFDKGFTLLEMVIYIGLFSILITSAILTAWELIEGSSNLNDKSVTEEEGNFVLRKIDWALTGTTTGVTFLMSPSPNVPYTNLLTLTKASNLFNPVIIRYNSALSLIEMQEGSTNAFLPLTTSKVKVTSLQFHYISPSGTSPVGVSASTTINGIVFQTTKYVRK